ncbi:MAG: MFS transporter [Bacteroidia bacterium]
MQAQNATVRLGLGANRAQFALLVLINALVGGMVGMERSILPALASEKFGMVSHAAVLSFIVAFGLSKALANYYTGRLANYYGRKKLLLAGWLLALPVPWLLMSASHWEWVVAANVLLGISQGFAWSSTVVMKIDLVGEKDRGLAMGLNEFAGYLAVGLTALLTGWLANRYGLTPYPFYVGVVLSVSGLLLTLLWVNDTRAHVQAESGQRDIAPLQHVLWESSWKDKTLGTVTQAGLVNNLNDGMIWGLLPVMLSLAHFNQAETGMLVAIYPAVWGIGQVVTGKMADHYSRKKMLFWGMLSQAMAILLLPAAGNAWQIGTLMVLLGLGTALVYPTFLTAIAAATSPQQRAESIGVFRLWRDLGYAFGAVLSGVVADWLGLNAAVWTIGLLTLFSALVIWKRMPAR